MDQTPVMWSLLAHIAASFPMYSVPKDAQLPHIFQVPHDKIKYYCPSHGDPVKACQGAGKESGQQQIVIDGMINPDSATYKALLGHELLHWVQGLNQKNRFRHDANNEDQARWLEKQLLFSDKVEKYQGH